MRFSQISETKRTVFMKKYRPCYCILLSDITSKHILSITFHRQKTTLHEMRYLDLFWQTNKTLYRPILATSTRRTELQLPFNPLKPSDYYTYHHVWHTKFNVLIIKFIYVLCKQRAFPSATWTDWFYNRDGVCLSCGTSWIFIHISN